MSEQYGLTPDEVTAPPSAPPPGSPPLPLPTTGDVRTSQGQPPADPPPGYTAPESAFEKVARSGVFGPAGLPFLAQDMADMAARTSAASGGFRMSTDEMRALLPQWEEARDDLQRLVGNSARLAEARPPADEDASNLQIQAVRRHARLYTESVNQQYQYATAYVEALKKAITKVEGQDSAAADAVGRHGPDT
ncbi:hypothetical protein SAMN05421810_108169 [Amycolatopsis arida]|uniref:PE family protein n=1 Tax=Amycolatopsis arida TaxID=587909 RepID=A0A1I5Z2R2_9PSEU|nr:hypothetical protein [Amycolatopsis arida]TDX90081.1 hypothetical protein CLV69_108169 [Amycolatopsis arida]SFQ50774.1 hypothetical protein SAMN05421810_108169 [Amycolatopsis arida]